MEPIWRLKPEARTEFQKIGAASVALMAVVGAACGLAAVGLARNAESGRRLAIGVLTVKLIGDSLNAFFLRDPRTLIGLPIGGLMILYLKRTRRAAGRSRLDTHHLLPVWLGPLLIELQRRFVSNPFA
jgi:hypothetical protein